MESFVLAFPQRVTPENQKIVRLHSSHRCDKRSADAAFFIAEASGMDTTPDSTPKEGMKNA